MRSYTRDDYKYLPQVTYENVPGEAGSYADLIVSQTMLTLPETERRKKPRDLFASSTSRQVKQVTIKCIQPRRQRTRIWSYPNAYQTLHVYDTLPEGLGGGFAPSLDPLMSRTLSRIKDQKVNLAVMIPELGKTTDMFVSFARDVYEGYKRLRRGQFIRGAIRDRRRTQDRQSAWLARRWLELSYGWKPTMSDIWGLSQELQKVHTGNYKTIRLRAAYERTRNLSYSGFLNVVNVEEVKVKMTTRYREEAILKSASALGITNPLAVAWELTPYSFVLDWAIGVGDYLNNLDALVGVSDCQVAVGTYQKSEVSGKSRSTTLATGGAHGLAVTTTEVKTRNGVTLPWQPLPQLDGSLSLSRAANALALLRTLKF